MGEQDQEEETITHTHTYADTVKQYAILNLRKRYFTENKRSHPPIYMIVMLN